MSVIQDVRQLIQDLVTPDLKAIDARLTALEKTVEANHQEVMNGIRQITNYTSVIERLSRLEAQQTKQ